MCERKISKIWKFERKRERDREMDHTVVSQKPSKLPKLVVNNLDDFKKNMMLIRAELSRGTSSLSFDDKNT